MGLCHSTRNRAATYIDLQEYSGVWYEFARSLVTFEPPQALDVTTEYTVDQQNRMQVVNCMMLNGKKVTSRGYALAGNRNNTEFMVAFSPYTLPVTYSRYRILAYKPGEYSLVVATWSRKYSWILTRSPTLDPETFEWLRSVLKRFGYENNNLHVTYHQNRQKNECIYKSKHS